MVREVVLCADLGSGSLRVGAVTAKGKLLATASAAIRASDPATGGSATDADSWWRALSRAVSRTLDQLPKGAHVRGVCLSGITRSQVLIDREGRPLAPALLFRDHRAIDDAVEIAGHFPTGNPADAITAFHPIARIAWFARRQPKVFARIRAVLEPKDFLNFRITGEIAADSVTYSRYDYLLAAKHPLPDWLDGCLRLLELRRVDPWQTLGRVTSRQAPWSRLTGVPVFAGAMDAWATAVGSGAVNPGQGYDIAGTSEVAGLITSTRALVPGLVSLIWGEQRYQIGGPTQAGADCASWAHATLRVRGPLATAVERAGKTKPASDLPLFLPYLTGERTPIWRADVRGTFEGLARGHDADDFLWAVLEGVAMAMRDILLRAVEGSDARMREVRVSGGGAQSSAWCQIKADVMQIPVVRTAHRETGLIGAAMAAAVGLGWHESPASAANVMCPAERMFEPRTALAALYGQRAERYVRARRHAIAQANASMRSVPTRSKPARSVKGTRQ